MPKILALGSGGSSGVTGSGTATVVPKFTSATAIGNSNLIFDATDSLSQRRGGNPQTFNLYFDYTDASNNGGISFTSQANPTFACEISSFVNGSDTAQDLRFRVVANRFMVFAGASNTSMWDMNGSTGALRGTQVGSIITQYNATNTAGMGVAPIYGVFANADVDQTASLSDTTLFTAGSTGLYRFSVGVISNNTCAIPGPAAVTVGVKWTDAAGAKSISSLPLDVNGNATLTGSVTLGDVTSFGSGVHVFKATSGSTIKFNTTLTACTTGTAKYQIDPAVEQLR